MNKDIILCYAVRNNSHNLLLDQKSAVNSIKNCMSNENILHSSGIRALTYFTEVIHQDLDGLVNKTASVVTELSDFLNKTITYLESKEI